MTRDTRKNMTSKMFLTFNAGSSTIKIGVYRLMNDRFTQVAFARVNLHEAPITLDIVKDFQPSQVKLQSPLTEDLHEVVEEVLAYFETHLQFDNLLAVGHRVVHGGDLYSGPIVIDQTAIKALEQLIPLAPLHQPQALFIIRAIAHLRPNLKQTASFDTAFHQTQSNVIRHYAIPKTLFEEGIKRFGFHGLSYQYIQSYLTQSFSALAKGKVVVAHLGSGASLCAMDQGFSRDCSMGFSTLGGVPMETRCGDFDTGAILYLSHEKGLSTQQIEHLLYKESGLLGISGISGDPRKLLISDQPSAKLAIEMFTLRCAGEIGRMMVTLGGLETLIFTGGIGEHLPEIRAQICQRLSWLDVDIDLDLNSKPTNEARAINSLKSKIKLLVIPTNEEDVIAKQLVNTLAL